MTTQPTPSEIGSWPCVVTDRNDKYTLYRNTKTNKVMMGTYWQSPGDYQTDPFHFEVGDHVLGKCGYKFKGAEYDGYIPRDAMLPAPAEREEAGWVPKVGDMVRVTGKNLHADLNAAKVILSRASRSVLPVEVNMPEVSR